MINSKFKISEHRHTRRNVPMHIVTFMQRVNRDEYQKRLAQAKNLGGWYSRKWGKIPNGFAFTESDTAIRFAAMVSNKINSADCYHS